jgi:hypothetical protein
MHAVFFTEVWLTNVSKIRKIASSDWPRKRSVRKKSKAVPLQAWSGPEGSRKLRFPDFFTTAQYGGKVVSLSSHVTGLEWPRGLQEVKVPRFLDNGTVWW